MAIKCGNCKGLHDTVQEVANCHGKETIPPTPGQIKYLTDLRNLRDVPEGFETTFNLADKGDVSRAIDFLIARPFVDQRQKFFQTADVEAGMPQHGTYTVQFDEGHRTIRFRKPHPKANHIVVEYLYGPDNTNHFKKFGREVKGGMRFFADAPETMKEAAKVLLLNATDDELKEMGYQYALKSGNCYICGRKLTVPASIHAGMGPVCAGKL